MSTLTFVDKLNDGFSRLAVILKQNNTTTNGRIGNLLDLDTVAKASLVAAINEVLDLLGDKTQVNDAVTNSTDTWSSDKISTVVTQAMQSLLAGADEDNDTFAELAARITALAQADNGLISAVAVQMFDATQQARALANIGAVSAAAIGDHSNADFVVTVNTAYAGA